MTHRISRYAAIVVGVVALTGAGVAPAHAVSGPIRSFTATATTLTAVNQYSYFPLGPIIPLPVSISRLVDGAAQVVASGKGVVQYQCDGTAINTYTANGVVLSVPCG
ncbi:hypothetical protein ACFVYA_11790 [Amycolatopsis sp. NPDC058278]|uniref:hypothetical protein n=1 Tax=unclassified Amycolatopsis TaxID=2618356 RepID=UPI00255C1FD7|nr:hypothetical protein [Amycolatopsis sp. DG1A-15b]WIX88730.1 hypothetical protein QRY02_47795 [Amycolatopsis sp. DG1A-15b]